MLNSLTYEKLRVQINGKMIYNARLAQRLFQFNWNFRKSQSMKIITGTTSTVYLKSAAMSKYMKSIAIGFDQG